MTSSGEAVFFWILGPIAVMGALALVFAKKAVHAALGMVLTMVILGLMYIAQGAEFLGVIQIFVYTGAVIMLFLFVLMLVGVDSADGLVETIKGQRLATVVLAVGLGIALASAIGSAAYSAPVGLERVNAEVGNVSGVALLVFGRFVWVFESVGLLLVISAVAAMVLAHRERLGRGPTQKEWSKRRVRSGQHVAGLPAPGVYARHDAIDTPALLPDGSISELSVSRVLTARDQVLPPEEYTHVETDIAAELEEDRD